MRTTLNLAVISAFTLLSAACSDPAPAPGAPLALEEIVGHWEGTNGLEFATLDITPSGGLSWERNGMSKTSLNGATVTNLTTTGFDASAFVSFHFVMNAVPHTENGVTNMTLDGIVLTKGPQPTATKDLEAEVARLKAENETLKHGATTTIPTTTKEAPIPPG